MTSGLLYRTLYVFVHCLFTAYEWIVRGLEEIGAVFVDFYHEFPGTQRTNYLKNEIKKKNKLPKHLTVLLGKEEPSYKDLANIVLWCLVNGIIFLSFYDYQGTLKKHQDKLEKEVSKKVLPKDHIIWHNTPGSIYKNGYVGRKIHIKILSRENGKPSVANLAKELCRSTKTLDYTIKSIDHALQKDFEFPDPDLGLNCGRDLNFFDYPPWQIRITEFLSIKRHYRIRYRTFLEQLFIYGKCEQRLGK